MVRWKLRSCPRCSGDIFVDSDLDSWYEQCLQCSYRVELKPLEKCRAFNLRYQELDPVTLPPGKWERYPGAKEVVTLNWPVSGEDSAERSGEDNIIAQVSQEAPSGENPGEDSDETTRAVELQNGRQKNERKCSGRAPAFSNGLSNCQDVHTDCQYSNPDLSLEKGGMAVRRRFERE